MDDILSDSSALLSIYSLEKAEKRKVFLDCSSLRHLNLHILVLYVKIHLKKNYRNLTAMIIAVYIKKCCCIPSTPSQHHSLPFQPSLFHYSFRWDCLMPEPGVPSICALTSCSLDRSECESIGCEGLEETGHSDGPCALFMSRRCWVGSYSASKSQMWFNLCSIHCPDCWPLITSKVHGRCWISAGALCYGAQSASLIEQRSITRLWKWARVCSLELIGRAARGCIYNIY